MILENWNIVLKDAQIWEQAASFQKSYSVVPVQN